VSTRAWTVTYADAAPDAERIEIEEVEVIYADLATLIASIETYRDQDRVEWHDCANCSGGNRPDKRRTFARPKQFPTTQDRSPIPTLQPPPSPSCPRRQTEPENGERMIDHSPELTRSSE